MNMLLGIIKIVFFAIILMSFLLIIYLINIGDYLDVTQEPVKSDIVACLASRDIERIYKASELYRMGYSYRRIIILTGRAYDYENYIKKNIPRLRYILDEKSTRTSEEIKFIKQYMVKHNYKSVIIISDPPHSRRIKILTKLISVKNDENLSYIFVGSNAPWWDPQKYYKSRTAVDRVISETLKILYTYINYILMQKLDIGWEESKHYTILKNRFIELKHKLLSYIDRVWKWHSLPQSPKN